MTSPKTTRRILLLDDEPAIRRSTSRMLRRAGYEVHEAATAGEARSVLDRLRAPVHLLICDLQLGAAHGSEAAAMLRASSPEMRVLFVSGGDMGDLEAAPDSSGAAFLPKPFGRGELLAAVERTMK